jgi:hypothetical protein
MPLRVVAGRFAVTLPFLPSGAGCSRGDEQTGSSARDSAAELLKDGESELALKDLGYHLKTGHTLSVQNRPTRLAEDVIVLPCRSVRLQG